MTTGDDLLRRLADADAASPPPPGREFSPTGLVQAAKLRTVTRLVAATAAVSLLAITIAAFGRPSRDDDAAVASRDELRTLRADVARLQATVQQWSRADAASARSTLLAEQTARAAGLVRCELAAARADALHPSRPANADTRR